MLGHPYGEKHQSWEFSLKELADKVLALQYLAKVTLQEYHAEGPGQLGQARTTLFTAWIKAALGERTG